MDTNRYGARGRRDAKGREERHERSSRSSDSSPESSGSDEEGARYPLGERTSMLKERREEEEEEMRRNEERLKAMTSELYALRRSLEHEKTEKIELVKMMEKMEEDLKLKDKALKMMMDAKKSTLDDLKKKEREMEQMEQENREERVVWEREITSLEKKLKETQRERVEFQKRADHYQGKEIQLKEENEELVKDINQLEEENDALQDNNDKLQDFKQLCVAILTGEKVDTATLREFVAMVGGDELKLHVAVSLGAEQLVGEMMYSQSRLLWERNGRGWTPLQLAVARGDPRIIQESWNQRAARDQQPPLLHLAAANHHMAAAKLLKRKKLDKKAKHRNMTARDVAMVLQDQPLADVIKKPTMLQCFGTPEPVPQVRGDDIEELVLYHSRSSPSPRNMGARRNRKKRGRRSSGALRRSTSSTERLLPSDGDTRHPEVRYVEREEERGQRRGRRSVGSQVAGKRGRDERDIERGEERKPKRGREEEGEEVSSSEGESTEEEARGQAEFAPPLPLGVPNLMNTCYMGSVVQCLCHIQRLASRFRELEEDHRQGKVVRAMVKLWSALQNGAGLLKRVRELKSAVAETDDSFRDSDQKEAHDFLSHLLDCLHTDMVATGAATGAAKNGTADEDADRDAVGGSDKPASFISDLFRIINRSTITCNEYVPPFDTSEKYEAALHLSLPVSPDGPYSLKEVLARYYRAQQLDWDCDRCGTEHECHNKIVICKLPPVLALHLSRVNEEATSSQKVTVTYPLAGLIVGHTRGGASRSYSLTAVCCHEGSMMGGHYTAFCRNGEQWFSFNDTFVRRVDAEAVLNKRSAHILFYEAEDTPL